jgi:hypothetical protein
MQQLDLQLRLDVDARSSAAWRFWLIMMNGAE